MVKEYIDDMANCLAAADLVISRSGAITVSELAAAGRASILIPSPNVAENHQYYNALELATPGAAILIEEKDLTGQKLIETVDKLTQNPETLVQMGQAATECAHLNSLEKIYAHLEKLIKSKRESNTETETAEQLVLGRQVKACKPTGHRETELLATEQPATHGRAGKGEAAGETTK